ncbi:MAG TPA: GNAT family N-acetyltransferase [Candidatus Cybelea sp.]|nr:GNAT family N-acetyltransferase [Candidatus Cybelea sp.]
MSRTSQAAIANAFTLRPATPADAEAVAHLHRLTFDATYPDFPKLHGPEEDLRHFDAVIKSRPVLVAEQDGRIVGYCAFGNGWVDDLYVHPAFQSRGIGSRLLAEAQKANPELQLWTFQANANARAFYEKHGFVPVEETDGSGSEEKQPDIRFRWRQN